MAISRSPSEVFIKFLLSQQEHEPNTILRMLEDFGLEGLSLHYIKKLQTDMEPFPHPWEPVKRDGPSRDYLKKHGIYDLWFPNPHVKEAYEILSNPQLRADVEQLLLSPLRIEEVVARLNKHHEISLTIEGVQAFGHYFWNKKLLAMHDWIEYLEQRPDAANSVAVLRVSPDMAQALVPWVMGLSGPPSTLNTGTVARRMRDIAFLKVLEIERQPATLAHSKMMKNYMDVIKDSESEMRQSDVALKDVLQAFEKFRLRKDEDKIPSIEEVAGPNYSQSGSGTGRSEELADAQFGGDEDNG
jgi:hypothetical protein